MTRQLSICISSRGKKWSRILAFGRSFVSFFVCVCAFWNVAFQNDGHGMSCIPHARLAFSFRFRWRSRCHYFFLFLFFLSNHFLFLKKCSNFLYRRRWKSERGVGVLDFDAAADGGGGHATHRLKERGRHCRQQQIRGTKHTKQKQKNETKHITESGVRIAQQLRGIEKKWSRRGRNIHIDNNNNCNSNNNRSSFSSRIFVPPLFLFLSIPLLQIGPHLTALCPFIVFHHSLSLSLSLIGRRRSVPRHLYRREPSNENEKKTKKQKRIIFKQKEEEDNNPEANHPRND